jgi:DNA-binding LacI/PurR family transcriptional regulator
MATIRDVARAAGVSSMTVSNVLNSHPHVRDETRAKVLAAIAELDYRVNPAARNLRSRRMGVIGLAVPDITASYFALLAEKVSTAAAEHGLRVVIEHTDAVRDEELEAVALSRRLLFDGLILSTVRLRDTDLLTVDYPVVILGEQTLDVPVPRVVMPNVEGTAAAVTHLLSTGSRSIAMIGGDISDRSVAQLRNEGFILGHTRAGLTPDPRLFVTAPTFDPNGGAVAANELIQRGVPFDAVFCVTDDVAIGALHAFGEAGIAVPHQVRIIGFDNVLGASYTNPSLSSVAPDHSFMASAALNLLVQQIESKGEVTAERVVSPFSLALRRSTEVIHHNPRVAVRPHFRLEVNAGAAGLEPETTQ